jgi:hypothetical protein
MPALEIQQPPLIKKTNKEVVVTFMGDKVKIQHDDIIEEANYGLMDDLIDKVNKKLHAKSAPPSRAGGGGGSAPPPTPTPLEEKQAEAATKMEAAIAAATPGSISTDQKNALLELITNATTEPELDAIVIPDASSGADVITTALKALLPEALRGGKRRRKTNKRARKGKRGTRRHL